MTTQKQKLTLAYSSCPNDTYIFDAIANHRIDTREFDIAITLADVETLNMAPARASYDVTKLSFAAFGNLRDTYGLLRTGAALGRGCGPLLITRPGHGTGIKRPVIAVPGLGTTACLLLRFYLDDRYPGMDPILRPMPFDTIMPSVQAGESDMGVIIHEGRFVYEKLGFTCVRDLGQWWEETTSLPIPLGCIAIRRSLGPVTAARIEDLIHRSILYADAYPDAGMEYIRKHAKEL
ncbi:MAG: 1,4-dihydroxy-6-naphthoate synthase, partial [Pseudomonadota bacterium]